MNTMTDQPTGKLCSHCGSWRGAQPLEQFDKDSHSRDGHRSMCKSCRRERRYARLGPTHAKAPKFRQSAKYRAKNRAPNTRAKLAAAGQGVCLALLFTGGFAWSTLNGSFAFLDTAPYDYRPRSLVWSQWSQREC